MLKNYFVKLFQVLGVWYNMHNVTGLLSAGKAPGDVNIWFLQGHPRCLRIPQTGAFKTKQKTKAAASGPNRALFSPLLLQSEQAQCMAGGPDSIALKNSDHPLIY